MSNCPHCGGELTPQRRTGGTRVDEILSPDELADLIEACRRPPRPLVHYYPSIGPDYVSDRTRQRRKAIEKARRNHADQVD